jgi:beta-glucosidase
MIVDMEMIKFPEGFLWGAASAAYQVEGYPLADGAGPTNWHEFTHRPGTIKDGTNGDIACDHYHRHEEDVRLMREMGLHAYRFSVGWGRIFPEPGRLNQKGIDFYSRLVDLLLDAGIDPWITVFHLEEPLWLSRMGGFTNRASIDHLVELAVRLFTTLGDRVRNWITVNEPTIYAYSGYVVGEFPPGQKFRLRAMLHCCHNLVLAHARICEAWAATGRPGMIGLAHNAVWVDPADQSRPGDVEAAAFMDEAANGSVLGPLLRGCYPERLLEKLHRFFPRTLDSDLSEMKKPGTYVGINYYTRTLYRWSRFMPYLHAKEHLVPGSPRSAMWEVYPKGLYATLVRLKEQYGNPPCIITENGYPLVEAPGRDPLEDGERIEYLQDHLAMVASAISRGVDCRGYFCWSLMDNFEWNWGLSMRFGLLRIDFATQARQWKKSAFWYRDLMQKNGLQLPEGGSPT